MRDTRQLLENWGLWCRTDTGAPQGYPTASPMFRDANPRDMREPGWGEEESPPEDVPIPVNIPDAEYVDKLICTIKSERLKLALLIEYASAPKSFRFRRYGYDESVREAERLVTDLLQGDTKKALILRFHQEGKSGPKIAELLGVSHQYVYQLTGCK